MKLSERRCLDKHDVEPAWILVCGDPQCPEIIADETECGPYVRTLEAENEKPSITWAAKKLAVNPNATTEFVKAVASTVSASSTAIETRVHKQAEESPQAQEV